MRAREHNSERCEPPKDLVEARGVARVSIVDKKVDIEPSWMSPATFLVCWVA
jgi:hypothetical protein